MQALKYLRRDVEGSALIEFTVLTPMLFTLVLGVLEFSFYFYQQQLIEAGVRDAARYMSRVPSTSNPCAATDSSGTLYTSYAQNIALYGQTMVGASRVKNWTGPVTFSRPITNNNAGLYASDISTIYTISASSTFTGTLGFFGFLHLTAPAISVTHKERFIGNG